MSSWRPFRAVTALVLCAAATLACDPPRVASTAFGAVDVRRCKPAEGTTGRPQTIAEAVELINGLPSPVTSACVLEALQRPLQLEVSKSPNSAQPAVGERSPRVFIFSGDKLVITAATAGEGQNLIEFGETVAPGRSVKAELEFPLETPFEESLAYTRIRNPEHDNITTCFVCHDDEVDEAGFPGGRSSMALRPHDRTILPLSDLQTEYAGCDAADEPARCMMLGALVAWGPVEHRAFDPKLPSF